MWSQQVAVCHGWMSTEHDGGSTEKEGSLTRTPARSVYGAVAETETNSHGLPSPVEEKGWQGHSLKGRAPTLALTGFYWLNLHRNTGKAHQSLSGSKDQTIDNIQRTLRAYSESGSVS